MTNMHSMDVRVLRSSEAECLKPLVLTGFAATGKTSAGRVVATRLGIEFLDMDEVLERREGKTVRAVYLSKGEAYLRARESELCGELALCENVVIATGGGALVPERNRALFAGACVVCLDASTGVILARLGDVSGRPLFGGVNRTGRIYELLHTRRQAYARIPLHVDTTAKTITQVADQVIRLYREGENHALYI